MSRVDLSNLTTEAVNPRSAELDAMSTLEVVTAINDEDHHVAEAVRLALPSIASAIDAIVPRMQKGGRLVYLGAGTSGRLGVLDAVECPPTFSSEPSQVCGLIAGGERAFFQAVEGAEDNPQLAVDDLCAMKIKPIDCIVGIAASGRTPFVVGALEYAREVGALTVAVTMNRGSLMVESGDIAIEVETGPEVLTGSTRLKAGTATKMVLNMLSTGVFVRLHKVYGNLMVDVQATNEKLRARSIGIVAQACACGSSRAAQLLQEAGGEVKVAIVVGKKAVPANVARSLLLANQSSIRAALLAPA
jgi:N-acetylmuramic acid 6-phosphate etherase